jgi:tol-pal system protein YbgF
MNNWLLAALLLLAAAGEGVAQPVATVDGAQATYDAAFGLMRARDFAQAEGAWQSFLRQYPDHALDASAQFFLGESFFNRAEFRKAAAAYGAGADKWPRSDIAPEMLLKMGIALGRSGQAAAACDALARLERDYPATAGVVRERGAVEKRQYHCGETQTASIAAPEAVKPAAVPPIAPRYREPPAPGAAIVVPPPTQLADLDPAPPAQPVTPVSRERLTATDAERAAARAQLYVTPPPAVASAPPRPLRASSAIVPGDAVRTIQAQTLLAALDYDVGPVDGHVGPRLREAVRQFETRSGLHSDGDISDKLVQRLNAALVAKKSAPAALARRVTAAGTGFVVSKSGFVVTSHHLAASCPEIMVRRLGAEPVAASLVASDAEDDLALLHLKTPTEATVRFRDGRGVHQGDGVVVTGFAAGSDGASDFYLNTGTVGASARAERGVMKISAALGGEHGGAPVFDRTGHLVGVLAAGLGGKSKGEAGALALRAAVARDFLDAHDVDYESGASAEELKGGDIGDLAKAAIVLVECRR